MKNIIYIYADDMGRGMLSCYGQRMFTTPHIDELARTGTRFTNFYGAPFCAPARASLICGIHDVHSGRWGFTPGGYYKKLSTNAVSFEYLQEVLQNDGIESACNGNYLGTIARAAGYTTAEIGKLEWGFSVTASQLEKHGWDYHYGYYDHIQCHGYYPPFLFENGKMVPIEGNSDPHCGRGPYNSPSGDLPDTPVSHNMSYRRQYSQDLFDEKILSFIRAHQHEPFFLYHPSQLPHGPVFYPKIHPQVRGRIDLTQLEKEYASMVLRLDETVGKIVAELERLHLRENTLILFASDNGHTIDYQKNGRCRTDQTLSGKPLDDLNTPFRSETCGDVFNGNDSMAGLKFSNWNGGCCIPFIANCPGFVREGVVCDTLAANYDTLATIADLCGMPVPSSSDGVSYLPLLTGQLDAYHPHEYVVYGGLAPAISHQNGWKLRMHFPDSLMRELCEADLTHDPRTVFQLYNWKEDLGETQDVAAKHPDIVNQLKALLLKECDGNFINGISDMHRIQPVLPPLSWQEVLEGEI